MSTLAIDRQGIESAVRENPRDSLAVRALHDSWLDAGASPVAAARRTNKVYREALAETVLAEMTAVIAGQTRVSAKARTLVRSFIGHERTSSLPIVVVLGDSAPVLSGEEGYHTFRNGGVCHHPGAAKRAGYRIEYHRSTLSVTVGAKWVADRI